MKSEKLCECGCGERVGIAKGGPNRGQPNRFVHGHNAASGPDHRWWDGGTYDDGGYVRLRRPEHPRSDARGYVLEHILVVEGAIGGPVPPGAVVHHVNGDPADNRPENLVLCEDQAYHLLLHQRQRALHACGEADWRKCTYCGEYDAPGSDDMRVPGGPQQAAYHRSCATRYERQRREEARS